MVTHRNRNTVPVRAKKRRIKMILVTTNDDGYEDKMRDSVTVTYACDRKEPISRKIIGYSPKLRTYQRPAEKAI